MTANEIWLPLKGFDGLYEVSDFGKVKSLARTFTMKNGRRKVVIDRIRVPSINHRGYERMQLTKLNGDKSIHSIHRLVALSFIPNPDNKPEVNHKNGIKTDNSVGNLEWATKKENEYHAIVSGLKPHGNNHPKSKLNSHQVAIIKTKIKNRERSCDIAKEFNISPSTICAINKNRVWVKI